MKPIKFKGMDVIYAENQPEYLPLPALQVPRDEGGIDVISCWKLTWWESIKVLFTRTIWIHSLAFGSFQPILPEVNRPFKFGDKGNDRDKTHQP